MCCINMQAMFLSFIYFYISIVQNLYFTILRNQILNFSHTCFGKPNTIHFFLNKTFIGIVPRSVFDGKLNIDIGRLYQKGSRNSFDATDLVSKEPTDISNWNKVHIKMIPIDIYLSDILCIK